MSNSFSTEGSLEDAHIWQLAQRIKELNLLGLKTLKIPSYTVNSALYNKRDIQDAAYKEPGTMTNKANKKLTGPYTSS